MAQFSVKIMRLTGSVLGENQHPMVPDQPATQTDQDWCPRHPSRPRNYLPTGRGGRHRPDGARHPRRHPPIASATAMRVTAIWAKTQRKRLDRSVRRAEEQGRRASTARIRGGFRPNPGVFATADTARGEKRLIVGQRLATVQSDGRPLGECRVTQRRGPIHPLSTVPATSDDARRTKRLISRRNLATLTSSDRPVGECRSRRAQKIEDRRQVYVIACSCLSAKDSAGCTGAKS